MKTWKNMVLGLVVSPMVAVWGAQKDFPVQYRQTIIQDGVKNTCRIQNSQVHFRVEVISDEDGFKPEDRKGNRPFVTARKDERYSVRVYNPLPVRVAVNLTVDGLNSISGGPCGISDGTKWIIDPYSFITIRGWQVNNDEARRFFFTDKPKSYAKWRGDVLDKDLSVNCGVIGAAFFWSSKELQDYYDSHPLYVYTPHYRDECPGCGVGYSDNMKAASPLERRAESKEYEQDKADMQAGTGMGERESHPTRMVEFHYDRGMYKLADAVVIYYDFEKSPRPNPFPDLRYAPEM